MRNLSESNLTKIKPQNNLNLGSKRINVHLNHSLLTKCQNFLTGQQLTRNYTYPNLSDLLRKSLIAYQKGELNLTVPRPLGPGKKTVGIILPFELWEYYQSLPIRQRTNIIESCLINYLNTI